MNREKKVVPGGPSSKKFSVLLLASMARALTESPALVHDHLAANDDVTEEGNAIVVDSICATMQDLIETPLLGLGAFLGSAVNNDRSAANGSGDCPGSFSMFRFELFNKVVIYKGESATCPKILFMDRDILRAYG